MDKRSFPVHLKEDEVFQTKASQVVKKNTSYYLNKWKQHQDPSSYAGWNWAAFFLPPFWLSYRHMYGQVLVYFSLLFLSFIITAIFPFLIYYSPLPPTTLYIWSYLSPALISLYFGWKGNALYAKHVYQRIHHTKVSVPLFNKTGASIISAWLVPVVTILLLIIPALSLENFFEEHFLPNGVYVYDEELGAPTISEVIQTDTPRFSKYDSAIQLLYNGKNPVGDNSFQVFLQYRKNEGESWTEVSERSYTFFSSNRITLNLLDAEDPLTETGEYRVKVYVSEEFVGEEQFFVEL